MTRRTLIALTVVALLIVPGLSVAAVQGSPDLSVQFTNDDLVPGEQTTLDLVVLNEGQLTSSSVSNPSLNGEVTAARGLTVKVNAEDAPFSVVTGKQAVGTLPEGATDPIPFTVSVDDDADPGSYTVEVVVSYTYTSYISEGDGARQEETVTDALTTKVRVQDGARMNVVNVSSDARVGSTGELEVTVENAGSVTANDTELTLTSGNGHVTFGQSSTATRFVDSWEPGERRTFSYDLTASDDARVGEYPFTLSAAYEKPGGRDTETSPVSLGARVDPEQTFAVGDVNSTLAVGDEGQLSGEFTNTGNRTVENVVLVWNSEQQNVNPTETEYAIGDLAPGESAAFDFDVEVSDAARSGPRQFSLVAEYDDQNGDSHQSDPLSVRESVGPERDEFDVEVLNASVAAGGSASLELRLTNAADEPLSDVSAKLFADDPISVADDEAYVEQLPPGESTTLLFSVSASPGALEKPYPVSMDFQYDEPDGDTVTSDTYRIPVDVDRTSGGGGGPPVAAIGVIAVLAVVGFVAYRRFL